MLTAFNNMTKCTRQVYVWAGLCVIEDRIFYRPHVVMDNLPGMVKLYSPFVRPFNTVAALSFLFNSS